MVFLDDNHNADHVYRELQLYSPLVGIDGYLVVADTVFEDLAWHARGRAHGQIPRCCDLESSRCGGPFSCRKQRI